MLEFLAIVFVIAIFFALLTSLKRLLAQTKQPNYLDDYFPRDALMTKSELDFFHVLKNAVPENYHVNCGVRLLNIIDVKKDIKKRYAALNKINRKEIDFVVTDNQDLKIIFAVELDDRSHLRKDRIKRDEFVNALFEKMNVPLLRVPQKKTYSLDPLKEQIESILSQKTTCDSLRKEPSKLRI